MTDDERELLQRQLRRRLETKDGAPEVEVIGATPILWSGWEGDHDAVLFRILPDGRPRLFVSGSMGLAPRDLMKTLRERIEAYKQAIAGTEDFLALVERMPPPELYEE